MVCHKANKFAQNSIYLSSQQATRYFGKLPLRVVMRFVFFRSKLRGIRPLAIDMTKTHVFDRLSVYNLIINIRINSK
ncbi:hypothetical protein PsalMR5_04786 (plasmid) [Piscirickettsia salmonis]|uniref:hypothetical protein n=1 Tax=Piscirickettsia salmonis TaxID=1238 RepID=UPI0012BAFADD|nr:hypothetical protein [Piscirickettsia salmonis]QGP57335.1 hypothetical protein PsalSR1_04824 [Piscirickettsia salmonis]QGP62023.1 hypothetical protein PsalBI1_04665 [Piscirickettsia salmonis]QGP66861.1 hypothetical protein PsalMR5_04786 [Piscirickettsia salmonis]